MHERERPGRAGASCRRSTSPRADRARRRCRPGQRARRGAASTSPAARTGGPAGRSSSRPVWPRSRMPPAAADPDVHADRARVGRDVEAATHARPPVGPSSVQSIRTVVVLPAPLGPRKPRSRRWRRRARCRQRRSCRHMSGSGWSLRLRAAGVLCFQIGVHQKGVGPRERPTPGGREGRVTYHVCTMLRRRH